MPKLELYLSKIVKYGLYAILLTPLAFWPKALFPFLTPKFILFQILVEIIFAAWLALLVLRNSNLRIHSNSTNNGLRLNNSNLQINANSTNVDWDYIKNHLLTIAILIFIAVSFISAIFGIDFQRSFWGIGARMTGLFAELHFFAWFLVLTSVATRIRSIRMPFVDLNHYINFSFAVSILVALTAFYQNTQWHLVPGYTIFSNPTFVAPYFLFHFFWGLYQIFIPSVRNRASNIKFWLFAVGSALILWALFLGQVRGAFVGLLLGVLFLGIGLIFSNIFKARSRVLIAVLYAIIVLGLILGWQFRDSKFIEQSYFGRFSHISFEEATVQTRFLTWQAAFKGFWDKPILGAGPENFNYLFNARYNPRLLMYGGSSFAETWQDKPHNAFVEILTETGIIGGLAYISIWLFVVFYLFRIFKRGEKFLSLILASAFISYLGAIFFSFDSFGSWFGLYLIFGFLASHSNTNNTNNHANNTNKTLKNFPLRNIFVTFVLIFIFVLEYWNYGMWRANLADADALRYFSRDPSVGVALFKKSLNYWSPYQSEYQFDLIASVGGAVEKGIPLDNLEDTVNFALNEADKAVAAHPNNAGGYTDMLRVYNILGTRGRDPGILNQAEIFGKKSLALSPNRQETFFYLARTALLKNNPKLAVQLTKQAVDIDPVISVSHWYLGLSYIANNQINEGKKEVKKALESGYQPQNKAEEEFIKNLGL